MFGESAISIARRGFSIALLAAILAALVPASASAAPKGYVASWACDDGHVRLELRCAAQPELEPVCRRHELDVRDPDADDPRLG